MAKKKKPEADPTLAKNRKAFFTYHISDRYEAGIVLSGSEVKSIRERRISLDEAFVKIQKGEVWLVRANISPYGNAREFGHDPVAKRKLLLKRREIDQLVKATEQKGFTIVPLRIFTQNGFIKVEIGVAKGKAAPDKRETIKRRMADRDAKRAIARRD